MNLFIGSLFFLSMADHDEINIGVVVLGYYLVMVWDL